MLSVIGSTTVKVSSAVLPIYIGDDLFEREIPTNYFIALLPSETFQGVYKGKRIIT